MSDGHRPRPIDRTPGTPGSDKKIKMAAVQKGGQRKSPPKSKKRRATESSTDEEKTPKIRNKKLNKKKQKMGEKLEDSVEGGSDLKTVRYVDSPEKEEDERRVSLVDTPERESVAIPDGSPVRNVMIVETSQEGTSDEDQWKPDREVVLKSSEGDGEDQGLQTGNRLSSSESTNWVINRRTVGGEVHSTTEDATLQENTPRRVKEGETGIDDETDEEMEDELADEDLPLVEEAVYEDQPSDDEDTPAEELELAEQMEKGLEMAQSKEARMMRKNMEFAKHVRVGLAAAVRRLPLPAEKVNKKKEDDDGAHYSQEEKREREAQKEKERAEAMREEKRAKGSSSEKRSGQPKAKGGSPRGADDL